MSPHFHVCAERSLMPAHAAAAVTVLPLLICLLSNLTCASVTMARAPFRNPNSWDSQEKASHACQEGGTDCKSNRRRSRELRATRNAFWTTLRQRELASTRELSIKLYAGAVSLAVAAGVRTPWTDHAMRALAYFESVLDERTIRGFLPRPYSVVAGTSYTAGAFRRAAAALGGPETRPAR